MKKKMVTMFAGCLLLGLAGNVSAEILTFDGGQLMGTFVKDTNYEEFNSLDPVVYQSLEEVELSGQLGGDWTFFDGTADYSHLALFVVKGKQYDDDGTVVRLSNYDGYSLKFKNKSEQPVTVALGVGYSCPAGSTPLPDSVWTVLGPDETKTLSYSLWNDLTCGEEYPDFDPILVGVGFVLMQANMQNSATQLPWSSDYYLNVSAFETE